MVAQGTKRQLFLLRVEHTYPFCDPSLDVMMMWALAQQEYTMAAGAEIDASQVQKSMMQFQGTTKDMLAARVEGTEVATRSEALAKLCAQKAEGHKLLGACQMAEGHIPRAFRKRASAYGRGWRCSERAKCLRRQSGG